jgi:DNA invertase Pin-like site-specific DNA recombinase
MKNPAPEKQKTCVIYCRVSSKEQVEGTSLDSQERACREYAERNDLKILNTFREMGESAKSADRTELTKAVAYCTASKEKVSFFIVYKLDRFSRNREDHVIVQSTLKKYGTFLRSVTEPIDESPVGKLMDAVISGVAEFDNSVRAERTRLGMIKRFREGIWVWAPPLGYYKPLRGKGTNIAPHSETAPYIKMAFEEYAKGNSTYKSLASFLADRGFRTKQGRTPSPQLMEKILRNPIYYGRMESFGEVVIGEFDPIISEELFLQCQKDHRNSAFIQPRSANNPAFPLRKLVICSDCGTRLTGSHSTGKKGKKYPFYHHGSKKCSKARSIPKETFEQQFVELLDSIVPDEKYEKMFKAIVIDAWENRHKEVDDQNGRIQKDIERLQEDRLKIFEYHRRGVYSDNDLREQKQAIDHHIEQKRLSLRTQWDKELEMNKALEYCFDFVRSASRVWLESKFEHRLRLQKLIFEQPIPFDGEKFGTRGRREWSLGLSQLMAPRRLFVAGDYKYPNKDDSARTAKDPQEIENALVSEFIRSKVVWGEWCRY